MNALFDKVQPLIQDAISGYLSKRKKIEVRDGRKDIEIVIPIISERISIERPADLPKSELEAGAKSFTVMNAFGRFRATLDNGPNSGEDRWFKFHYSAEIEYKSSSQSFDVRIIEIIVTHENLLGRP